VRKLNDWILTFQ